MRKHLVDVLTLCHPKVVYNRWTPLVSMYDKSYDIYCLRFYHVS
jgi:hypothetical protein